VDVVNLHDVELALDADDPPGYSARYARLGPLVGSALLGGTVYELDPGNSNCPYHYEYGNEEWLLCLGGVVTIRTPDGELELRAGDVICFPDGPAGAHKVTNKGSDPTRVVIFSTKVDPSLAVYPDSDKVGAWAGPGGERIMVRRSSDVDYWDGEL
jgi:uncharacterized cupin superfamily protein